MANTIPPAERAFNRALEVVNRNQIARKIGTTRQNVYQWRRVPAEHIDAVAEISGVPAHELRPDLRDAPE